MSNSSGVVADEKFKPTTSISGNDLKAEKSVMVLPDPGGPQRTIGLWSANQVFKRDSCLTVSKVGTTISGEATL